MHQVQEELERQFLSHQDLKAELEAQTKTNAAITAERDGLSQDKAALSKARDSELKAKQALQAERDQLAKDKAKSDSALKEAHEENELLLTQMHQVQEELERQFLSHQDLKAELEAQTKTNAAITAERDGLSQDKAALTKACDSELKAKQALQAERDQLAKDKAKSDSALKEAHEENELLLTQMHQVQEELERQFLDNQANKSHLHQTKASKARVMANFPGAFDCESLQLVSGGEPSTPWRWRAQNLGVAGHHVEQLEFQTVIEQGLTGIALQRDKGKPEPMLRWPLSANGNSTVMLIPLKKEQEGVNPVAVLAQLSASDWDMNQALLRLLVRRLAQGLPGVPAAEQTLQLQATLRTSEMMRQLQGLMRFDAVTLVGHQAVGTREVLSLQFTHLSHRSERLEDFKFQLQAQPISAGAGSHLGGTVHLIVGRDTAAAPFEHWISNANDGSGLPVMAIPLSERGPMGAAWERLSAADRAFVAALVDALPLAMALLNAQGKRLPRPWKDWSELTKQVRQWVRLPPAQEPANPAPPAIEKVAPTPAKRQHQRSLSVAPVIPKPAPQATAAQKAPPAKKQTKVAPLVKPAAKKAAVPQTRAHAKKPAAHRSARPRVSARAGK
jgi:chemotaxis protein histidine kinase CheA